ncbi:hypothetical protein Bbelb_337760 [Branchiostoma belcheri]|nr:hypothetical protein Bbelb_337760 [Branchiostoma belcheri]
MKCDRALTCADVFIKGRATRENPPGVDLAQVEQDRPTLKALESSSSYIPSGSCRHIDAPISAQGPTTSDGGGNLKLLAETSDGVLDKKIYSGWPIAGDRGI